MTIRILIADDHKLMREGLRGLIENTEGMEVIAEARNGGAAVQSAAKLSPDIIIMDISMPGLNGIEATRQILAANASVKVLALSMHLDKGIVLSMLEAGASGYLLKDCAFDEVVYAIQTVASNCTYLSPQVAKSILKEFMDRFSLSEASFFEGLSSKEQKVLHLMAEGKKTARIAALLKMEPGAVENLRNEIILKHLAPAIKQEPVRLAVSGPRQVPAVALSAREKEILLLVMKGKNSAEMAAQLDVSRDTIKFHMKKMFKKMHTTNSPQTVAVAMANGLI